MNRFIKKKDTILFAIYKYQQYINYINTGALNGILDKIIFIVPPNMAELDYGVPKDRVIVYSYPNKKDILHRHIFNLNTWQKRKSNNVFLTRSLLFTPRQCRMYSIISLPIINSIFRFIFLKRAEDKKLFNIVKKVNPSIILLPSHAFEGRTFELIRIAQKIDVPSFMLTENWNTLANKTIFTIKPDYLGVWSRQHIDHAIKYRGMLRDKIFILGAPRFVYYMREESKKQPSPYSFRYALYVGISEPFDELRILRKLEEIIERRKLDLKIVYRPNVTQHTRKCQDVFFEYDFKHVILDTPARLFYKRTPTWDISKDVMNPVYYPDPGYFPKLFTNMEFMIGPPSTMFLECGLYGKKMYLIAFEDEIHDFGPKFTCDNGVHIWDLPRLKDIRVIHKFEDIEKVFAPADELMADVEPLEIDYFVAKNETANYSENLKETVDTILTNWEHAGHKNWK